MCTCEYVCACACVRTRSNDIVIRKYVCTYLLTYMRLCIHVHIQITFMTEASDNIQSHFRDETLKMCQEIVELKVPCTLCNRDGQAYARQMHTCVHIHVQMYARMHLQMHVSMYMFIIVVIFI